MSALSRLKMISTEPALLVSALEQQCADNVRLQAEIERLRASIQSLSAQLDAVLAASSASCGDTFASGTAWRGKA